MVSNRFERFTTFKPPALPEVCDSKKRHRLPECPLKRFFAEVGVSRGRFHPRTN
jgi:hypothetical protein